MFTLCYLLDIQGISARVGNNGGIIEHLNCPNNKVIWGESNPNRRGIKGMEGISFQSQMSNSVYPEINASVNYCSVLRD